MEELSLYTPVLCGTLPIEIDIDGSDLDIIMEVHDFTSFKKQVENKYGHFETFRIKEVTIRNIPVIKANFTYENFEFELFGQPQAVIEQNAYLHMIIEDQILKNLPTLRKQVIRLKQQGWKTEPAFCKLLGLNESDPYLSLIEYGKAKSLI